MSKPGIKFEYGRWTCRLFALLLAVTYFTDGSAEDFYSKLRACAQEHDAGKRLGCFDREIAALRPPEPEQQAVQDSRAEFGLSEKLKGGAEKPQKETDRVAAVTQRPNAALMISLENGQVWKATEQEYFPVNVGDSVTIYAGALGSFWLSTAGTNRTVRVTRVGR